MTQVTERMIQAGLFTARLRNRTLDAQDLSDLYLAMSSSAPPVESEDMCARCNGLRAGLAYGREPEELCDPCYDDSLASLTPPPVTDEVERAEALEEVLRGLASTVGAGGYNAEAVDPDAFDRKIRWGIDNLINMTIQRCADVVEEQSKTYARSSYGDCKRAVLNLKVPEGAAIASLTRSEGVDDAAALEAATEGLEAIAAGEGFADVIAQQTLDQIAALKEGASREG